MMRALKRAYKRHLEVRDRRGLRSWTVRGHLVVQHEDALGQPDRFVTSSVARPMTLPNIPTSEKTGIGHTPQAYSPADACG